MGTTLEWYREGGPMMIVISVIGIAGLAILLERVYVIVIRSKNNGRAFIERIIQLVRAGKAEDAIKQCAASTAALSDIGLLLLRSRSKDEAELQHLAHAAALAVLPKLSHRLQYLLTLGVAAILMGVAGTLAGFHRALTAGGAAVNAPSRLSADLHSGSHGLRAARAWPQLSREPIRDHHRADSRVLRSFDQRAGRSAGCASRSPLTPPRALIVNASPDESPPIAFIIGTSRS